MAMPIYTDEIAHVEARGSIMLLTFKCAGQTVQVAMTHYAANSVSEGIKLAKAEAPEMGEVIPFETTARR